MLQVKQEVSQVSVLCLSSSYRSTREFMRKYNLRMTAATFLIIEPNSGSVELACQWQKCMGGEIFIDDLECSND